MTILLCLYATAVIRADEPVTEIVDVLDGPAFGIVEDASQKTVYQEFSYAAPSSGVTYNAKLGQYPKFGTTTGNFLYISSVLKCGVIFSAPEGLVLKQVVVTYNGKSPAKKMMLKSYGEPFASPGDFGGTQIGQIGATSISVPSTVTDRNFAIVSSGRTSLVDKIEIHWGSPDDNKPEDPQIWFSKESVTVRIGEEFTLPTLSTISDATVTYKSSDTGVATIDASTGAVSLVAKGTTTITASVPATEKYLAGEASYKLIVNNPIPECNTIAQWLAAKPTEDATPINCEVTVIAAKKGGNYIWVYDAEGSLLRIRAYVQGKGSLGYEIGDVIPAGISGRYSAKAEDMSSIVWASFKQGVEGEVSLEPEEMTLDAVEQAKPINKYVVFKHVNIGPFSRMTSDDSEVTLTLFGDGVLADVPQATDVNVTGIMTRYGANNTYCCQLLSLTDNVISVPETLSVLVNDKKIEMTRDDSKFTTDITVDGNDASPLCFIDGSGVSYGAAENGIDIEDGVAVGVMPESTATYDIPAGRWSLTVVFEEKSITLTAVKKSGLEIPDADGMASSIRYYNLQGLGLDTAPTEGIYIEVRDGRPAKKLANH